MVIFLRARRRERVGRMRQMQLSQCKCRRSASGACWYRMALFLVLTVCTKLNMVDTHVANILPRSPASAHVTRQGRRTLWTASLAAAFGPMWTPFAASAENDIQVQTTDSTLRGKKVRRRYDGYRLTSSGLQVKDASLGRDGVPVVNEGDIVELTWEGYEINNQYRPIESKRLNDLAKIVPDPLRFRVGDGTVIPAVDEAVRDMRVDGIRELIVPPALGYDAAKRLQPRPHSIAGQKALDALLDSKDATIDKTLQINIKLKKIASQ